MTTPDPYAPRHFYLQARRLAVTEQWVEVLLTSVRARAVVNYPPHFIRWFVAVAGPSALRSVNGNAAITDGGGAGDGGDGAGDAADGGADDGGAGDGGDGGGGDGGGGDTDDVDGATESLTEARRRVCCFYVSPLTSDQ